MSILIIFIRYIDKVDNNVDRNSQVYCFRQIRRNRWLWKSL